MITLFAGYFLVSVFVYLSSQVYDALSIADILTTILILAVVEILPFLGFLFGRIFIRKQDFSRLFLFFSGIAIALTEMLVFNILITEPREFYKTLFIFVCSLTLSQVNLKNAKEYLKSSN